MMNIMKNLKSNVRSVSATYTGTVTDFRIFLTALTKDYLIKNPTTEVRLTENSSRKIG